MSRLLNWLDAHLLPCPFKYITSLDCPGCGFQRSLLMLAKGNVKESISLYPATIILILLILLNITELKYSFKNAEVIKRSLSIFAGTAVVLSYWFKIISL